jgi:thymidylate kinase
MHIAIEGMDGVGKTTAAHTLAKLMNCKIVEKPLHYLFDRSEGDFTNYIKIRDYINAQVDNDVLRAWFYGFGNIFIYHRFKDENIITDRHFGSNYFWCGWEKTTRIFDLMIDLVGKPDFTYLIYATEKEIKRRIRKRGLADPDYRKVEQYPEARVKMENFFIAHNLEYVAIDTTNLNEEAVIAKMINTLPLKLKQTILVNYR